MYSLSWCCKGWDWLFNVSCLRFGWRISVTARRGKEEGRSPSAYIETWKVLGTWVLGSHFWPQAQRDTDSEDHFC